MPNAKTLDQLFLATLRDIFDAERQILKALPRLEEAATADSLKSAFEKHCQETEEHVSRLEAVFAAIGEKPRAKRCAAIRAIIAEGEQVLEAASEFDDIDLALIASARTVEHYEITRYATLKSWATRLGQTKAAELLGETLAEEKTTDLALAEISEKLVGQLQEGAEFAEPTRTPGQLRTRGGNVKATEMNRQSNTRERDDRGRFMPDDDRGYRRSGGYRDRDERGRYASDDDEGRRSYSTSSYRDRDERGRFVEDDDRRYARRDDDDDRRSYSASSYRDRDERGRFVEDDDRRYARRDDDYRSRDYDDDRRYSRSRYGDEDRPGHGGWYGDPEGHAEAARRGWREREDYRSSSRGGDDDRRYGRSRYEDEDRSGHGGWFGDPEGHAEAARRGWRNREDDDRSSRRSR